MEVEGHNRTTASLLNRVSAIAFGVTIASAALIDLDAKRIAFSTIILLAIAGAQIVLRRGKLRLAAHLVVLGVWSTVTAWLFLIGGTRSYVLLAYSPIIAMTAVVLGRRSGLFYGVLSTLALGALFLLEHQLGAFPDDFSPPFRFFIATAALMTTGFVIVFSARLQSEADTRAVVSEAQYAELVRTAPDGIVTIDADGVVRSTNPAADALFGASPGQLVGRPVGELPGLGARSEVSGSVTIVRADDSEREVEVEVRPLNVLGRVGKRINLRDITVQRAAERDRARLTEQLAQVQRLESVGLLAGGIAHDFNNVITVSLANLHLLRARHPAPEAVELLDDLEEASRRMAELTRKLLAFSRRQVMHVRTISVNGVVEGVRPMLRRLVTEAIEMRFDLKAQGVIAADPGQLEQVLMNLVVNARDAMPEGGTLTVATADRREHERDVVMLSVEDTGTGIPAEVLPRVFEPFFTTKAVGHGTGLGLSVVDGIVKQSGGTVSIDSVEQRGTRFEIRLPCVEAASPDPVREPERVAGDGRGRVVLVIEDEASLLRITRRTLEAAGFEVIASADGEEALRAVETYAGVVDAVVADVVMPRLGGPEVVARLRERWPSLKALFVSGYTDRTLEELGARQTNSAFLGKPFRGEELVAALSALLAESG